MVAANRLFSRYIAPIAPPSVVAWRFSACNVQSRLNLQIINYYFDITF